MTSKPHMKIPLVALAPDELEEAVLQLGGQKFRAQQIAGWLYRQHVQAYENMKNVDRALLQKLEAAHPLGAPTLLSEQVSRDGTRKFLLRLADGASVECVALFHKNRLTACISSQVGCHMGCVFCATGQSGFVRNLLPYEMAEQVRYIAHACQQRVDGVVVMGQGEPFLNTSATIAALDMLNDEARFGIGARKITVSTAGVLQGIEAFEALDKQYGLAVSLHSAVQTVRDALMPGVKHLPLPALKAALVDYTQRTNRRVTLEYLLLQDVNDGEEDLAALLAFCSGVHAYVNLLRLHATPLSGLRSATPAREQAFLRALRAQNIEASFRTSRGEDIDAACGQLAQKRNGQPRP